MSHNPKCVEPHLWPHALKHANHMFNLFPREGKDKSPDQLFSCSAVDPNISELHPFGCPVHVTVHAKDSAWTKRAHLGVCLGPSPQHESSVGLILNIKTGYISAQFHCTYNDYFETPRLEGDVNSHWQTLAQIKDDECDLSHPEFDALNGEQLPDYEPKSTLFLNLPRILKNPRERSTSRTKSLNSLWAMTRILQAHQVKQYSSRIIVLEKDQKTI